MPDPLDQTPWPAIVWEDGDLAVVGKPVKMHSSPVGGSVREAGSAAFPDLCAWFFRERPASALEGEPLPPGRNGAEGGLVHRLDYETSGLLLFAKSSVALRGLLAAQAEGRFLKGYRLLCRPSTGLFPEGSRPPRSSPIGMDAAAWEAALGMDPVDLEGLARLVAAARGGVGGGGLPRIESRFRPWGAGRRRVACVLEDLRASKEVTPLSYRSLVVAAAVRGDHLEVDAELGRGFRHQLRAHFAWIGLPIDGDRLYGGAAADRLQLHAGRLRFPHPIDGRMIDIEDPRR